MGASAGGLEALTEFFKGLPQAPGAPFVVVLHLSPDFKSLMPELLGKHTSMPVQPAEDAMTLQKDRVYIIPPGNNMVLREGQLRLKPQDRTPGHALNLPVDLFLESAADDMGDRILAVILSGSGSDGSRGIRAVKEMGGVVLAQSPDDAKFNGMPLSAIQTGLTDGEGSATQLAEIVANTVRRGPEQEEDQTAIKLTRVHSLLRRSGADLSHFRDSTVARRVKRRCDLLNIESLDRYVDRLRADAEELRNLRDDLLIGVTSFFRDPQMYEALRLHILPNLLDTMPDTFRVWVTACSTGQEAYSIGMVILDALEARNQSATLRIFATDVDARALEKAARGAYSESEMAGVPPSLVEKYFNRGGEQWVVSSRLRQTIIFAQHNAVTDAPFSKMDLVCCRNLLIYLKPEGQRRILSSLYLALKPERGVLVLGDCESVHPYEDAFASLNAKEKIFVRRGPPPPDLGHRRLSLEPSSVVQIQPVTVPSMESRMAPQTALLRGILETSFELEGRTAALVNLHNRLRELLTDPLGLFRFPKGRPTDDLGQILPHALYTAVLALNQRLRNEAERTARIVIPEGFGNSDRYDVTLVKLPVAVAGDEDVVLVLIRREEAPSETTSVAVVDATASERIASLEFELRQTKESLQATIEELQSSNEEQQSSNEELVAANEELQSTNEELHSANEELFAVNAEFQKKNDELLIATSDLDNLLRSIAVASLYLDEDLRVRRFTPLMRRLIPLRDSDLGRSISTFRHHLEIDFVEEARTATVAQEVSEREVRDRTGNWHVMRVSPYKGGDRRPEGALFTFVDVTPIKNAEETARLVADQLMATNEMLRTQTSQLEDLFSVVAHDLRRHVLGVDGMLHLADEALQTNEVDHTKSRLDRATEALGGLKGLLRDLTEVARLGESVVSWINVDMSAWLEELLSPFVERAKREGVRLHYATDGGSVELPVNVLAEVANGLVENAFEHGTTHAEPRIEVSSHVLDGRLRFVVADNGAGIAPADHAKVFELFRKLNPDNPRGSGVGLAAARRLAMRVGGSVSLDSAQTKGCRFTVDIPLTRSKTDRKQRIAQNPDRVLIVEDDAIDAKQMHKLLDGHDVVWAKNIRDAERRLTEETFTLIMLDLSLPDGHGLSLVGTARAGRNRITPVIVLSSHIDGLDFDALRASGVAGAYSKDDFASPQLRTTVERILDR